MPIAITAAVVGALVTSLAFEAGITALAASLIGAVAAAAVSVVAPAVGGYRIQ